MGKGFNDGLDKGGDKGFGVVLQRAVKHGVVRFVQGWFKGAYALGLRTMYRGGLK